MLTYATLASGSSGNCAVACCGSTRLLVDAGISARRITAALKALEVHPAALSGILITHEHSDHISGLATLTKQLRLPVYATAPTLLRMAQKVPGLEAVSHSFAPGEGFFIGDFWVRSFPTSHDAACSVGYTLTGGGFTAATATDLGRVTPEVRQAVRGCDLLVCETNYEPDWLRSGPYPYYLQERIRGTRGHLSNEAGAGLAAFAAESGTRTVILGHLSAENNTPARAYETACARLRQGGVDPERDLSLTVAPRQERGPVFRLERGRDAKVFPLREEAALC